MDTFLGNKIANIKISTLVVGVINIGFIGHSYIGIAREEAYLSAVIICFMISFLWTMAIIVGVVSQDNEQLRKADMMFHMVACIFYLTTLIVFFVSMVDFGKHSGRLWERVVSFILGAGNTVLYGLGGYLLYRT